MDMQPLVLMSAKDLVTEKLREEIYTGNLKPGQELVQEKISEQLGVSRMPVREALLLLENAGLVISGVSPDGRLVETVELAGNPFFVGVQYHPEFKSRPNHPHPLFLGFVKASLENHERKVK